jgi:hypothetical protein
MVLTTEQRIELLSRAREAKKAKQQAAKEQAIVNVEVPVEQPPTPKVKKNRKKNDPLPEPVQVIQESESEEEVVEVPIPVPKKRTVPNPKWLKTAKTEPEKVSYNEKLTKESPLIEDEPQVVADKIVIPPKSVIKKPRAPRASSRTLDISEPAPIEDVLEEVKNNNQKYLPKVKQSMPAPSPVSIRRVDPPLQLFNY